MLSALASAARLRRGIALLACIGVLGWTLLSATHWHDHAEAGSGQHSVADCVLCLGSPAGAAPPALSMPGLAPPQHGAPIAGAAPSARVSPAPSAYRSRAPPAA